MGSIKKAFDLTRKNALVTGGSRGLGLQIAEALGEQGARVVISSRKARVSVRPRGSRRRSWICRG
jgi:NAD(P)-dependent dehydrogenase (short-subunit alcohol dehydrogenase family)